MSWQWQMYDSQRRNPRYLAMASSEDASPETTIFVQGVLREMCLKGSHKVHIRRFDEDADYLCWPTCIVASLVGGRWCRRYICVREDGFETLPDGQKRFLIAREVVKFRARFRQALPLHLILWPAIAIEVLSLKYQQGFGAQIVRGVTFVGAWLLFGYVLRVWECITDLRTAKELDDVQSAIGLIEREQRDFDDCYPAWSFKGAIVRPCYMLTRPLNITPSPASRLRYLQRELFGGTRTVSCDDEHED